MPLLRDRNLSFEPPPGWDDAAVCLFQPSVGSVGPRVPLLKVSWEHRLGETLRDHARSTSAFLGGQQTIVDAPVEARIGGRPALLLHSRGTRDGAPVEGTRAMVELGGDRERDVLVFTLLTLTDLAAEVRSTFTTVLESVRFEPAPAAAPGGDSGRSIPGRVAPERMDMSRYEHRGVSFEPPLEWTDVTIAAYSAPAVASGPGAPSGEGTPTITIARAPLMGAVSLRAYADRMIVNVGRVGPGLKDVESEQMQVGGRAAIRLQFRFLEKATVIEQTTVLVDAGRDDAIQKVTVIVVAGPASRTDEMRAALAALLGSVRFDGPLVAAPARPIPMPGSAPKPQGGPKR